MVLFPRFSETIKTIQRLIETETEIKILTWLCFTESTTKRWKIKTLNIKASNLTLACFCVLPDPVPTLGGSMENLFY